MLGVVVFALGRAVAAEALGIEAGKHLNPRGATSRGSFRPSVPSRLLDEPVNVSSKAVCEGVVKGAGPEGCDVRDPSHVSEAVGAVFDSARNHGFLTAVVAVGDPVSFVSDLTL